MPDIKGNDRAIELILRVSKIIAVVGHSEKPTRASYRVANFLRSIGYKVYPVNPKVAAIDGQICYPSLEEIPESVDIVNVFRHSDYLPEIVDSAIAIGARTLWTQLGIYHEGAAKRAIDAGLNVITDVCIQIEYQRLRIE
jgi:predicted CoA-binding protein